MRLPIAFALLVTVAINIVFVYGGSGCCSQKWKNCDATWCGNNRNKCNRCGTPGVTWLEDGPLPNTCLQRWAECTNDKTMCCNGLRCRSHGGTYHQCLADSDSPAFNPADYPVCTAGGPDSSPGPAPVTPAPVTPAPVPATPAPVRTPAPVSSTTTRSGQSSTPGSYQCALPSRTSEFSVITKGDATIEAHNVYTGVAIGGTFKKYSRSSSVVDGMAYMKTLAASAINWNGGKATGTELSDVIDFSHFEWLAQNAEESADRNGYKVVVKTSGGTFDTFDFCPGGQGEDNGKTLVIFNTSDEITLTKTNSGRQFGPSVIAPFSVVKLKGEAGFMDGFVVAKEFDSNVGQNPSQLQLHGDTYKGTITCKSEPVPVTRNAPMPAPTPAPVVTSNQRTLPCSPVSKSDNLQCIAEGQECYKITPDELTNPYGGCCDGYYCSGLSSGIWWGVKCEEIPSGYTMPPNPLGRNADSYVPQSCTGTEHDSCPSVMNLGSDLSASSDYQQDFPLLQSVGAPLGRDDTIAFLVKGRYTSEVAAEIEGKIVVLGDFVVKPNGVNTLVNAGVGSGIVPNDDQVVMTVGGDIIFERNGNTHVLVNTPKGGDVAVGGNLYETSTGKLVVKNNRDIIEGATIDTQAYLDMFDDLAKKSAYWATLYPNGIVEPALQHRNQNEITFKKGDNECLQVFHVDRFDLTGPTTSDVRFDSSLEGKTILINVASTLKNGKRVVEIKDWGKLFDTSGGEGFSFKSSTKASILWNFYDAEEVYLGGGSGGPQFPGSILIPNGDLDFRWPGSDGRVMVGGDVWQESTGSEFHNYEFDPPCSLPLPPDFPVPSECSGETEEPPETASICEETPTLDDSVCEGDFQLVATLDGPTPPDGMIEVVSFGGTESVPTVTFKLSNKFRSSVNSFFVQYKEQVHEMAYDVLCEPFPGEGECGDEVGVLTALCRRTGHYPLTVVHVWAVDQMDDGQNYFDEVPECCHAPDYMASLPKVGYTFRVACGCPPTTAARLLRGVPDFLEY